MRWLGRLELVLRRLIEGAPGRLLGARIQPVDLARRLADHMDDHRVIGAGRLYVPNSYRVFLAPPTLTAFEASRRSLQDDLADQLDRHAHESGYALVGRMRVELLPDAALEPDTVRIQADLVDRRDVGHGPAGEHTHAIAVMPVRVTPAGPPLALVAGDRCFPLSSGQPATLGRALDNDIILEHPSISRHHARLSPRAGHWLLEDLGSTHGSFVNGRRVSASLLRQGDRLRLGSVPVHLRSAGEATQ